MPWRQLILHYHIRWLLTSSCLVSTHHYFIHNDLWVVLLTPYNFANSFIDLLSEHFLVLRVVLTLDLMQYRLGFIDTMTIVLRNDHESTFVYLWQVMRRGLAVWSNCSYSFLVGLIYNQVILRLLLHHQVFLLLVDKFLKRRCRLHHVLSFPDHLDFRTTTFNSYLTTGTPSLRLKKFL